MPATGRFKSRAGVFAKEAKRLARSQAIQLSAARLLATNTDTRPGAN